MIPPNLRVLARPAFGPAFCKCSRLLELESGRFAPSRSLAQDLEFPFEEILWLSASGNRADHDVVSRATTLDRDGVRHDRRADLGTEHTRCAHSRHHGKVAHLTRA